MYDSLPPLCRSAPDGWAPLLEEVNPRPSNILTTYTWETDQATLAPARDVKIGRDCRWG